MNRQPSIHLTASVAFVEREADERQPWRLGQLALLLLTVIPAVQPLFAQGGEIPISTRLWASGLWVVCLGPAWFYLMAAPEHRRPIPFLPVVGILWGLYYALPILLGEELLNLSVWLDPRADYQAGIESSLLGWGALLAGYVVMHRPTRWTAFERFELPPSRIHIWGGRLLAGGLTARIAGVSTSALQWLGGGSTFLSSLAMLGLALLIMVWRRGNLSRSYQAATLLGLSALCLVEIGTGSVATLAFVLVTVALSYWAAAPRVIRFTAAVAIVGAACFILVLKGVTSNFRSVAWAGDSSLSVTDRAELAATLVLTRLHEEGPVGALSSGTDATTNRSSNADLLAEVIRRTPSEVEFWNGETYISLVGALVPRLFWPDKPVKNLGQDFGHRYGYLNARDLSTSYNFPWLVEAYANFGRTGIVLVCFLVGMIYATLFRLINTSGQSLLTTAVGIVVLSALFNIESDFSLIYGGLLLTLSALWGALWWIDHQEQRRLIRHGGKW